MGWVNSKRAPQTWASSASIRATSSSRVSALVHSDLGLSKIMTSAASMGMGSVGTSAVPILLTTCLTSGNFAMRRCSAWVVMRVISSRLLPVGIESCIAKSPSSRLGMNTLPSCWKTTIAPKKSATARESSAPLREMAHSSTDA